MDGACVTIRGLDDVSPVSSVGSAFCGRNH